MTLRFTKMHGLGNDFVVIDGITQTVTLDPDRIRRLADRHFGVGCDQLLLVEASDRPDADFRYRIFNADGGEVEQCGNGARCFARFVRDHALTDKDDLQVITAAGLLLMSLRPPEEVRAWLAERELPAFTPYTVTDKAEVQERLATFTRQGWGLSERQLDLDCRGIAVPLRDNKGDIHGALSVVMPIQHETTAAAVQRVLPALQMAAQGLRDII